MTGIPKNSPWTEERVSLLKELTALGFSAGMIADRLECSISRNAVIGKQDRMKISRTHSDLEPSVRRQRVKPNNPPRRYNAILRPRFKRSYEKPLPFILDIIPLKVGFMDAAKHHCRFVIEERGADGLAIFCGHEKHGDYSYCFDHCRLIYPDFCCEPMLQAAE